MTGQRGAVLIVTLMAMLLLSAIAGALVLTTSADVLISANAGASSEAFYGAEAVFERTLAELRTAPDFTLVLAGSLQSVFVDGPPSGPRALADGSSISLDEVVNLANCHKTSGCSESDLDASLRDRPWGARNPRWRLFSYGPLQPPASAPASGIPIYVVSMVADDPSETDDDPVRDGGTVAGANPGAGVLLVRAEGFGRRSAHRVIEGTVLRRDLAARALWDAADPATRGEPPATPPSLQVLAWRDIR